MAAREMCDGDNCDNDAVHLCRECLQEFILEKVVEALRREATAVSNYHESKRRVG